MTSSHLIGWEDGGFRPNELNCGKCRPQELIIWGSLKTPELKGMSVTEYDIRNKLCGTNFRDKRKCRSPLMTMGTESCKAEVVEGFV